MFHYLAIIHNYFITRIVKANARIIIVINNKNTSKLYNTRFRVLKIFFSTFCAMRYESYK